MTKRTITIKGSKEIQMNNNQAKGTSRRDFIKMGGLVAAAAAVPAIIGGAANAESPVVGKKWGMVIDLQRCVGCGACAIACKNENNVQANVAWASRIKRTTGTFPNTRYEYMPTLCNHCAKAPCVKGCPTKAMHKIEGNITSHDPGKCIGCGYCIINCPYGVIHFNGHKPQIEWYNEDSTIEGGTSSPAELTRQVNGTVIPYYNPARELSTPGTGLRRSGAIEKCGFCDHRIAKGERPYCVESCPANARIFGDLNDPDSDVSKLLVKFHGYRLKEDLGTEPKIYYIREFNPAKYAGTKGSV